jgi:hypothetical protein
MTHTIHIKDGASRNGISSKRQITKTLEAQNARSTKRQTAQNGRRHKTAKAQNSIRKKGRRHKRLHGHKKNRAMFCIDSRQNGGSSGKKSVLPPCFTKKLQFCCRTWRTGCRHYRKLDEEQVVAGLCEQTLLWI